MPCSDGGPCGPSYTEETKKKLDKVTDMLCTVMSELENVKNNAKLDIIDSLPTPIQSWWLKHKKEDAERLVREKAQKAKVAARKKALSKLTDAEKKLLGLR